MKKTIIVSVFIICIAGASQADMYDFVFSFDELSDGSDPGAIEAYMEGIYGSDITVSGGGGGPTISISTEYNGLGSDEWIFNDGGGSGEDWITFSFNEAPIVSVSFDWVTRKNPFVAVADGMDFFDTGNSGGQGISDTTETFSFADPVTTLLFHNSQSGWIGIDNLTIRTAQPIAAHAPIPAACLLGALGLTLAAIKLRKSN